MPNNTSFFRKWFAVEIAAVCDCHGRTKRQQTRAPYGKQGTFGPVGCGDPQRPPAPLPRRGATLAATTCPFMDVSGAGLFTLIFVR